MRTLKSIICTMAVLVFYAGAAAAQDAPAGSYKGRIGVGFETEYAHQATINKGQRSNAEVFHLHPEVSIRVYDFHAPVLYRFELVEQATFGALLRPTKTDALLG